MPSALPRVRVVSAREAAARDRAATDNGTSTSVLMQRAGTAAATEIIRRYADRLRDGALIFTGPGNNGGDGWVVAGSLAREGITVQVNEVVPAKSPDAQLARFKAIDAVSLASGLVGGVVVDAILGTGTAGALRSDVGAAVRQINELRSSGARVVALDIPTGLEATSGEHQDCVVADLTLTFDAVKRGALLARDRSGEIVVLDIGLDEWNPPTDTGLPFLVDWLWVHSKIPPIPFDAHKGSKKHLAVVGGGKGMAGAAVLSSRAALRSGVGILRVFVDRENVPALVDATPSALVAAWPDATSDLDELISSWAQAIVIGPGLGKSSETRSLVERLLQSSRLPVVLDADALNVFDGDVDSIRSLLGGRPSIITPHPGEFARLTGSDVKTILAARFEIGADLSRKLQAVVMLKGSPTVIFTPTGERFVSPRGSAALGTGGSGDLLSGIAGTLLAQTGDPTAAACCSAWVHGRAAELCGYVRGTTLEDVLYALPRAWNEPELPLTAPITATIPAVVK